MSNDVWVMGIYGRIDFDRQVSVTKRIEIVSNAMVKKAWWTGCGELVFSGNWESS